LVPKPTHFIGVSISGQSTDGKLAIRIIKNSPGKTAPLRSGRPNDNNGFFGHRHLFLSRYDQKICGVALQDTVASNDGLSAGVDFFLRDRGVSGSENSDGLWKETPISETVSVERGAKIATLSSAIPSAHALTYVLGQFVRGSGEVGTKQTKSLAPPKTRLSQKRSGLIEMML
jgi:hypothetical protein